VVRPRACGQLVGNGSIVFHQLSIGRRAANPKGCPYIHTPPAARAVPPPAPACGWEVNWNNSLPGRRRNGPPAEGVGQREGRGNRLAQTVSSFLTRSLPAFHLPAVLRRSHCWQG